MQTSLAEEREAQRRWELRPAHRHLRVFDRLVENEFLDPPQVAAGTAAALVRAPRTS